MVGVGDGVNVDVGVGMEVGIGVTDPQPAINNKPNNTTNVKNIFQTIVMCIVHSPL